MAKSGYFFRVSPLDQHADKLNKIIKDLIAKNVFSRVVRDAIRLYADLSDGKTEVLEELFPFVRNHYCNETDPHEMQRAADEAVARAMNRQHPANGSDIPDIRQNGFPAMKQSGSGIGTLGAGRVMALPTFDDEDDMPQMTIKLAPLSSGKNGDNFVNSLAGLGQ